jgi:methylthioribulose-1-phosphate dehydratase
MTIAFDDAARALVAIGRRFDARGWAPATSGNYSARLDDGSFAVTRSGRHKGRLQPEDILRVGADGAAIGAGRPSAETALHLSLYRALPDVHAVLHGHSARTVGFSRAVAADEWRFRGHEMLKAFPGIVTHESEVRLPIVPNSQDMAEIDGWVAPSIGAAGILPAYLIRDHGLYGWGADLDEAERVMEATEWLIECELVEAAFRTRRS